MIIEFITRNHDASKHNGSGHIPKGRCTKVIPKPGSNGQTSKHKLDYICSYRIYLLRSKHHHPLFQYQRSTPLAAKNIAEMLHQDCSASVSFKAVARGKQHKLVIALLPLLLLVTAAKGRAELHPSKPTRANACSTASYVNTIATNALKLIQDGLQQVKVGQLKAAQLRALGTTTTGSARAVALLLATELSRQTAVASKILETHQSTVVNAALAAAYLRGSQETVNEFEETTMQTTNVVLATNAVGGTKFLKTQPKVTASKFGACFKAEGTRTDADVETTKHTDGQIDIDFAVLAAVTTDGSAAGKPLTFCSASGAVAAAASSSNCPGNQNAAFGYVGGKIFSVKTTTATKKTAEPNSGYALTQNADTIPSKKTLETKLKEISNPEAAEVAIKQAVVITDLKSLATSNQMKSALAKSLRPEKPSYADSETQKTVDEFIKNTFGEKGEKVDTQIITNLNAVSAPKGVVGGTENKKLATITEPEELATAEAYYTITAYIAEQDKKKNQENPSCPSKTEKAEEPKKTAEECKKHTISEACKKEKGCDFDEKKDPKCFPKDEKEKKDEKSFSSNLRVSVSQVFAALILAAI